ncbi:DUF6234 family protein [Streptomyces sp. E11-3]|uniref:DUF6234 family protein n=1 Tax=Streptomyces sp. E11-3 TaxID=3110112 RepID=UPI00397F9C26
MDVLLAISLTLLELGALAAFLFVEGLNSWAARGLPVRGQRARQYKMLTISTAVLSASCYGFYRADLLWTALTQALLGIPLTLILMASLAKDARRPITRRRDRARLVRERRRIRDSQREGSPPAHMVVDVHEIVEASEPTEVVVYGRVTFRRWT